MKLGIIDGAYLDRYGLKKGLAIMREQGYECIDYQKLCFTESELFTGSAAHFESVLSEIREACASEGIEISQTHGPWRWPPQDATEEDRAERFEKMSISVRGTAILGCRNMVIHPIMPFGTDSDPEPERMWDMNLEFMRKLADEGQRCGVTVCYENMPFPAMKLATPEAVCRFVKTLDHPFFKVCLDTGHCAVLGISAGESVRLIGKEYLRTLHIHDNDGRSDLHWLPNTGVIDWTDFSNALNEIGFDGTASLETCVKNDIENGEARTAAELSLLESLKAIARR